MNKHYNVRKQAKETGSNELWVKYKKLRNEVAMLLREAETNYWRQEFKTDSIQSSSNYLQKLFTKNLLTARQRLECYLKHLIVIQFSKWPRDEIPKHSREI